MTNGSRSRPECECMACHLPPEMEHAPVAWELKVRFLGNFTTHGLATMRVCEKCCEDWTLNAEELDVEIVARRPISWRARGSRPVGWCQWRGQPCGNA